MYQLYYSPGACSMAVHVLLNELGMPFEAKRVSIAEGETRTPEFLKLNPRGQVPVLVADGTVIREGAAIMLYLMEEHNSSLLPRSGKPRANALEWLMYANSTLHVAYSKAFFVRKSIEDPALQAPVFIKAMEQINALWAELDAHLSKNRFVCGKDFSAADIIITVIANWGDTFPQKATLGPNVKRLLREVIARPSYQKAMKIEQVEYKAAA
jgi:glutathione S-transferase